MIQTIQLPLGSFNNLPKEGVGYLYDRTQNIINLKKALHKASKSTRKGIKKEINKNVREFNEYITSHPEFFI